MAETTSARHVTRTLLLGAAGLGALAIATVATLALTAVLDTGGSASPVRLMDLDSEPRDDAWGIISPMAQLSDLADEDVLYSTAYTVGQDRAIVRWWSGNDASYHPLEASISLVDTRRGEVLWTVEAWSQFEMVSAPGARPIVALRSHNDNNEIVYSIDESNGDVISEISGVQSVASPPGLGSDLVIGTDDGIGRYSPTDFANPKWMIDIDQLADPKRIVDIDSGVGSTPRVVGNRIFIGDKAYSVDTGEEVEWKADTEVVYAEMGGRVFGIEGDPQDGRVSMYSDSGETVWSFDAEEPRLVWIGNDVLLFSNEADKTMQLLDLDTGEERWISDIDFAAPEEEQVGHVYSGSEEAGFVMVATSQYEAVVIDLSTGRERFTLEITPIGDRAVWVLGLTAKYIYLSSNDERGVVAYDAHTGEMVWTLDSRDGYNYSVLGGNIVGTHRVESTVAESTYIMIGIQP